MGYDKPKFVDHESQCYLVYKQRDKPHLCNIHRYVDNEDIESLRYTDIVHGKKDWTYYETYIDQPLELADRTQKISCSKKGLVDIITYAKLNMSKEDAKLKYDRRVHRIQTVEWELIRSASEYDSYDRNSRDTGWIERDLRNKLNLEDETRNTQTQNLSDLLHSNRLSPQKLLSGYLLPKLQYEQNKMGGGSTVLGLTTQYGSGMDTTDITKPTFTQTLLVCNINLVIKFICSDIEYTTMIVHRGKGLKLHTEWLGNVHVATFGDNSVEVGKFNHQKWKFTELR